MLYMNQLDLHNQRVLIREDFNVPISDDKISNDARILAAIPTIESALKQQAKVILLSHLGRPTAGTSDQTLSLAPVAKRLSELLGKTVHLATDWQNGVDSSTHPIILCENVRFCEGETSNDELLAKQMANLCDIFVMDAFGTAHRKHASTYGVVQFAKKACAGPLLQQELLALSTAMTRPKQPVLAIIGGSKVSTKLGILNSIIKEVDQLIVGGGIANTLIAAKGLPVGNSLFEPALVDDAKQLFELAKQYNTEILLPIDVVTTLAIEKNPATQVKCCEAIVSDNMIVDIGPKTAAIYATHIINAATIIWNGPVGIFENPAFASGTQALAVAIAKSSAFSIAGGGDTIAAIDQFAIRDKISYISTGGGAFLAYIESKTLPSLEALEQHGTKL